MEKIYTFLEQWGYMHPLHPPLAHIPIGCVIAAFIFLVLSRIFLNPAFMQTGRHCLNLSFLFTPVVIAAGYMDWQYNYAGAMLDPIKIKVGLAGALFALLLIINVTRSKLARASKKIVLGVLLCTICVIGLGYFGAEMIYGSSDKKTQSAELIFSNGRVLFEKKCSFCHYSNRKDEKVGPGLKGITSLKKMTASGWPMSDENLLKQLQTPFSSMPAFDTLTDKKIKALLIYLKSL
ncbi:MAG: c-type cytochrome [Desulfobacteraceae bacterium]|nr:c-type cytochrome [Desulfobacteraceae bacterium]